MKMKDQELNTIQLTVELIFFWKVQIYSINSSYIFFLFDVKMNLLYLERELEKLMLWLILIILTIPTIILITTNNPDETVNYFPTRKFELWKMSKINLILINSGTSELDQKIKVLAAEPYNLS